MNYDRIRSLRVRDGDRSVSTASASRLNASFEAISDIRSSFNLPTGYDIMNATEDAYVLVT